MKKQNVMGLQKVGGSVLRESFHKMGHPAWVLKDKSKSSTAPQHIQSLNKRGGRPGALPIPGYLCPLQATLHSGLAQVLKAHKPQSKPSMINTQMAAWPHKVLQESRNPLPLSQGKVPILQGWHLLQGVHLGKGIAVVLACGRDSEVVGRTLSPPRSLPNPTLFLRDIREEEATPLVTGDHQKATILVSIPFEPGPGSILTWA